MEIVDGYGIGIEIEIANPEEEFVEVSIFSLKYFYYVGIVIKLFYLLDVCVSFEVTKIQQYNYYCMGGMACCIKVWKIGK